MAQKFFRRPPVTEVGTPIIGKASTTFAEVDPVYKNSDGFLTTAVAGSPILGFCVEVKTTASTNQTSEKYKLQYIPAYKVQCTYPTLSNEDCVQAKLYGYKDFSGVTSGGFTVALTNITGGQLQILEFDPYETDEDEIVAVMVAEPQELAYSQP